MERDNHDKTVQREEEQQAHWQQIISGAVPSIDTLFDYPRPYVQSYHYGTASLQFPASLFKQLSQNVPVPLSNPYVGVGAALALVLARHTDQTCLFIGSLLPHTPQKTTEDTGRETKRIGVLAVDLAADQTGLEFLALMQSHLQQSSKYRFASFRELEQTLTESTPLRAQGGLLQVGYTLLDTYWDEMHERVYEQNLRECEDVTAQWALFFVGRPKDAGLEISCIYQEDVFLPETVQALLSQMQIALTNLAQQPALPLSRLSLLAEEERSRVVSAWKQATSASQQMPDLLYLFTQQLERVPTADALVEGQQRLSYQELNIRANLLAWRLKNAGIMPGQSVGLFMERSLESFVAILAIMKVGASYVPLDTASPQQRIHLLLEEFQVSHLLTQASLVPQLSSYQGEIILIEQQESEEAKPEQDILPIPSEHDIVCIFATSGSTGKPKGVMITKKMLRNLIAWHLETHRSCVRTLQFAALNFDQSIHEMFSTWGQGGCLFVLPDSARMDVEELADYIEHNSIEKVFLPVVVAQNLAEQYQHRPIPSSLQEIIVTGEQLRITSALREIFAQKSDLRLYNHYGPTETHVVTEYGLPAESELWPALPPIGYPIANTQCYILDRFLQPVPAGIPGELYIGGESLSAGYQARPELTAAAFLPDVFSSLPGRRMYRTGDKVRSRQDGRIEFLGRWDSQIKIHGLRIEPGEIEAILTEHSAVETAVVLAYEQEQKRQQLIAYVVPTLYANVSPSDLRRFLTQRLPSAMIPTAFVLLSTLPLNANGKLDRSALPRPDRLAGEAPFGMPRSKTEQKLVIIWSRLLGLEQVGIYDNFFALGGHSLLGSQLISQVRKTFQVELTHFEIFAHPTIAHLAKNIEQILSVPQSPWAEEDASHNEPQETIDL